MTPDLRALLHDLRAYVLATRSLAEVEAQQRPERRTGHLALRATELVRRIDLTTKREDACTP